MNDFWEKAAERLQHVITAVPGFETETSDKRIKTQLAAAEPSATEDIRPFLKGFAEMDGRTFASVLATWRHKYQR